MPRKTYPLLEDEAEMEQWERDLKDMLNGPCAGHGGISLLAEELQVSRQAIYQWRTGRRAPNVSNRLALRRLARKYA